MGKGRKICYDICNFYLGENMSAFTIWFYFALIVSAVGFTGLAIYALKEDKVE